MSSRWFLDLGATAFRDALLEAGVLPGVIEFELLEEETGSRTPARSPLPDSR